MSRIVSSTINRKPTLVRGNMIMIKVSVITSRRVGSINRTEVAIAKITYNAKTKYTTYVRYLGTAFF